MKSMNEGDTPNYFNLHFLKWTGFLVSSLGWLLQEGFLSHKLVFLLLAASINQPIKRILCFSDPFKNGNPIGKEVVNIFNECYNLKRNQIK